MCSSDLDVPERLIIRIRMNDLGFSGVTLLGKLVLSVMFSAKFLISAAKVASILPH